MTNSAPDNDVLAARRGGARGCLVRLEPLAEPAQGLPGESLVHWVNAVRSQGDRLGERARLERAFDWTSDTKCALLQIREEIDHELEELPIHCEMRSR